MISVAVQLDGAGQSDGTFQTARDHLERAREARSQVNDVWNGIRAEQAFAVELRSPEPRVRELWCSFTPSRGLQHQADNLMATFISASKAALDACVVAAANVICSAFGPMDRDLHRMLLLTSVAEFDSLQENGYLRGLRPDHLRALRTVQPFTEQTDKADADAGRMVAHHMLHLARALQALDARDAASNPPPLFTAWASRCNPKPDIPDTDVVRTEIDAAGPLPMPKRLARLILSNDSSHDSFAGDPGVSFDVVINVAPWPEDPDDNFAFRSHGIINIIEQLINGLERSVREPYRNDLLRSLDDRTPAKKLNSWLPVAFQNRRQRRAAMRAIEQSDRGLATYLNDDGTLVYMRLSSDGAVHGREIAPARDLLDDSLDGTAVEEATRAAAGRWGLADFVLQPSILRKGSGVREIGDGTILTGRRGIALQVKARNIEGDDREKAAKWMKKNAAAGLRQARGTIRTALSNPAVELTNLRGRTVMISGRAVEWVPVVVLDHPNPPSTGVIPDADPKGPSVVLTRRDWEFLWNQLRSATAVVDYIHRVAEESDPLELGAETNRYFDLAEKDAAAAPRAIPSWLSGSGAQNANLPVLPSDPATSADQFGHAIFQRVLEDIARTDFTGSESDRLLLLSRIDQVAVAARADLGRLLLRRLITCAEAGPEGLRLDHRFMFLDQGSTQIVFTTMSQLTDYHLEMYRTWLLLRRQDFLIRSGAKGPVYPWTVGVLLTPRADGPRPWDTTVISSNGPPEYEQDEYERLTEQFRPNA